MLALVPVKQPWSGRAGLPDPIWVRWLQALRVAAVSAPQIASVSLRTQHAAIGATALPAPTLSTGPYRVTYSLQITQAASVSSSAQFTLGWTRDTVAQSRSGALLNGNTVTSEDNRVTTIVLDANTTPTYAVSYASAGGTPMQFALDVFLEPVVT